MTKVSGFDMADIVRRGDLVCWGQGPAEPLLLTRALLAHRAAIGEFSVFLGMSWSETSDPSFCDHVRFSSYCGAANNRRLSAAGKLDILPLHYSDMAARLTGTVDVLLLQLAPTGDPDVFSLSMACEYLAPLIESARVVVAEINTQAPMTHGERLVKADEIDFRIESSRALPAMPAAKVGPADVAIARRVAELVEDGAILQIGLGAIPDQVIRELSGHRHLGVHSGLINDGIADLIISGVITNERKPVDTGQSVTGLLAGSQKLCDLAHDNPAISLRATAYTHAQSLLAQLDRFTAINSAIEVDLTGQINAECAGGRYVGAVGGAADFLRGAHRSRNGLPIIALPSSMLRSDGRSKSRIVATLDGPVSTSRADAGIFVTEHGVADLRGQSLSARVKLMIGIAPPDHREELARQAHAGGD